jgi:hypothetical protein
LGGVQNAALQFGFNLGDSDAEAPLNFGDTGTFAEMPGFLEMLEIGTKFRQQLLRRPATHLQEIVAQNSGQYD